MPDFMRPPQVSDLAETHFLCIGQTQSGKSRWFEYLVRRILNDRDTIGWGFAAIDRKGQTARDLTDYLAYRLPNRKVIVLDCGRDDWIIPINTFLGANPDRSIEATLKVFGTEDANVTTRIAKWMLPMYHLFSTGDYTFNTVLELLEWENKYLREAATGRIQNPQVQSIWRELLGLSRHEYNAEISSSISRFIRFAKTKQLQRLMGLPQCALDFDAILEEGTILIVNLQETKAFSRENGLLVGTLIINALLHAIIRRQTRTLPHPYMMLIDEASDFLTADVREVLDKGAGPGLHLGLFLQNLHQIRAHGDWMTGSVLSGCGSKVIFKVEAPDARMLVDHMFVPDPAERTALIRSLAFQMQRQYTVHIRYKGNFKKETPKIEPYFMDEELRQHLILERFIKPYALPVAEIDAELERRLTLLTHNTAAGQTEAKRRVSEEPTTYKRQRRRKPPQETQGMQ